MGSRRYRFVVEGELSDHIAFEGMTLEYEDGNTVLTGPVRDQSELQGLLQHMSALGLTLLAVAAIDEVGGQATAALISHQGSHERHSSALVSPDGFGRGLVDVKRKGR